MMKLAILAVLVPTAASAGNPAWCKKLKGGFSSESAKRVRDPDINSAVSAAIKESCNEENDAYGDNQKQKHADVDKARAELSATLGMSEADWADAVEWDRDRFAKIELSAKTLDALTPIDQYAAITGDFKNDQGYNASNPLYTADALETKLTETGRLGLLQWCVKQTTTTHESDALLSWGVCAYDVEHFDLKKLYGELKSDTAHPGGVRFAVRMAAAQMAMTQLPNLIAEEKKLFAKDAAYKKPFEDTLKAREEWQKTVGANSKLLALVGKLDGGLWFHSRNAMEGCEAETTEALAAAVSKLPAKSFANMFDATDHKHPDEGFAAKAQPILSSSPEVHLAAGAYMECQPKRSLSHYLSLITEAVPGFRGPRMAALTTYRLTDYKFDDTKADPRMPNSGGRPYGGVTTTFLSAGGVVKSVKKDGEHVMVAVEKTQITQMDCVKEHWGSKVIGIDHNGKYVYELICDQEAPVTHDTTYKDFEMAPEYAASLKPGALFSVLNGSKVADVIAVWPNKKAKLPSYVLGGAVK